MPDAKPFKSRLGDLWRFRQPLDLTQAGDLDHPHIPPRVGAKLLSAQGAPEILPEKCLITVHGFSATPFETHFLLDHLLEKYPAWQGSQIMLGAHGSDIAEFRKASWQDWQRPLEQELADLQRLGYPNQCVIASSTGCTLLLELLNRRCFPAVKQLVLVAPLVEPREKTMRLAALARKAGVQAIANDFDPDWIACWYRELPLHAVHELDKLTRKLRRELKKGMVLPPDLEILIVQSRRDRVVDPHSASLIAQGLPHNHLETLLLDSHWHLPILPRPREPREDLIRWRVYAKIEQFLASPLRPWPETADLP
ncbi:hypothetical protein COW36_15915 [bacterium (Candidatus Blackallbacteria) CG17_big_fil_post_rev_8_21_14_2_50_48_46]|uniref:Serine aminopeptidase S33 domain-containing protein n=1 Tax=bacterium (Candidatus Blackallbacteria) CG17_big_fil_post_rev_8_21_14_2_50_48_46 TaxID=2014261 RepID=A0A2M7G1W6_9BACT|nr:MAG: hypothetical protein COW64_09065 [bacterium (Candidatus Blackallbacteria) CG18_big_fil_WC_8_21_14_2_50_49_26]PIW15754.1 MAG: hypothetical protein COW36_15915 [bacterium (Candidatus Blackallbacteria) CG17_big_fil_post_rev_8_21_14_2_50_48_46]PIW48748.1 MAG: hypothetical protein COW20_08340 [bacterium (Candidatus Blackallbacteria) CG13_big_fil_rev_8_21_14_2_50_49_14]